MAESKVTVVSEKLDNLLKAFKKVPTVKVGIMGESDTRSDGLSNATIGAIHEFGFGVPMRSFLRMPLISGLSETIEENLDVKIDAVADEGSVEPLMRKIGIMSEELVRKAFDTGGNGKWPKWTTPGYTNNTGQLLVDTQQLRDSITSAVLDE